MNQKIKSLLMDRLQDSFSLPRYRDVQAALDLDTRVDALPWTPVRFRKFQDLMELTLGIQHDYSGTVADIVCDLDSRYMHRFFSEVWRPNTDTYQYSGWALVPEINGLDPEHVLDVGCGYNQFKGRIQNLVGIDPYNNSADYMVDILDYHVPERYDAIMVLGSVNFGTAEDILERMTRIKALLAPGGRIYVRANPGIAWKNGPWLDIFPWSFEHARLTADQLGVKMTTFKKDNNDRLYFVYELGA